MKKQVRAAHVKEPEKKIRASSHVKQPQPKRARERAGEEVAEPRVKKVREPKEKKPIDKKKLIITLSVVAAVLLMMVGGGLYAGYRISNSPLILPHVLVGDINIGGMDTQQAKKLLENNWQARAETPLTVSSIGGAQCSIDPVKSGMTLSADAALETAYTHGHDGNIVQNLFTYIERVFKPVDINALSAAANNDYLDACIADLIRGVDEYMGEEEYTMDFKTAQLSLKKGWSQIAFDTEDLRQHIVAALSEGRTELEYTRLSKELKAPDFSAIYKEYDREPRDASYSEDGKFDVIDEVIGCRFDVAEAEKLWNEAQAGELISIPLELVLPQVTGAELRDRLFHDLLGACTTKYPNSGEQRRSNLRLATSILNEYILYPGETISFNDTVGERTEAAGFLPAPAYVDGDVKEEIGGGVCQVSSTLYAATAFAFLETVERECHFFAVNYMQRGTDATVTIPGEGRAVDFKFKNNKNYPIKIVGYCDNENSTITFEIWGTLEENDYMPIKFDNSYSWEFDYVRDVEPAYEGRAGYTIKLTHELYSFEDDFGSGYRTLTYREVYDENGQRVANQILNPQRGNGNYAMDTYYFH